MHLPVLGSDGAGPKARISPRTPGGGARGSECQLVQCALVRGCLAEVTRGTHNKE
jgi:hypothetical protein